MKKGDVVKVVNMGLGYSTYEKMANMISKKNNFRNRDYVVNGMKGKIIGIRKHEDGLSEIALIRVPIKIPYQDYLIQIKGLKKVKKGS